MNGNRRSQIEVRNSENGVRGALRCPNFARAVSRTLALALALSHLVSPAARDAAPHDILIVVGAAGAPEFEPGFAAAAGHWRSAAEQAGARVTTFGLGAPPSGDTADRDSITAWFAGLDPDAPQPAWFAYVGHGTWDGREARLNLRGADLSGTDLKLLLAPLDRRPTVIVHGGSASGPLIPILSAPNRVIITATATGDEVNYARFGERFAEAIGGPTGPGDIDMDGQTSVLEAFVAAARSVELYYAGEGRLATEHALIDDNGDGRGTPPEFFRGTRTVRRAADGATPDGAAARRIVLVETPDERALTDDQRTRRDRLEEELEDLRARRSDLPEADYLRHLERILRALAAIYAESDDGT